MADEQTGATAPPSPVHPSPAPLTPELVREVAEKVYALWLSDLKRERERWRVSYGKAG